MRRLLALFSALLFFTAQALPAGAVAISATPPYGHGSIGYVGSLITGGAGSDSGCGPGPSISATTSKSTPAGALILVWVVYNGALGNVTGVSDTVGNTYVSATSSLDSNTYAAVLFYSVNSTALPSGDSIILSLNGASGRQCYLMASAFTGVAVVTPLDKHVHATNTGTAVSLSSGTLSSALEVVAAATWVNGGGSDSFTEASGFSTDTTLAGSTNGFHSAHKIVFSPSSVTYAPTLGTSRVWNALAGTFIGAP